MILNFLTKAKDLFYSNKSSGLSAGNVQSAIDEVKSATDTLNNNVSKLNGATVKNSFIPTSTLKEYLLSVSDNSINSGYVWNPLSDFPRTDVTKWYIEVIKPHTELIYAKVIAICTRTNDLYIGSADESGNISWSDKVAWNKDLESIKLMAGNDWNTPFDLKPTTSAERLGGCYMSSDQNVAAYHAPALGYAFTFGERRERFANIFVNFDGNRAWFTSCHTNEWKELEVKGTTVWENPSPTTEIASQEITLSQSYLNATHFEVIYALGSDYATTLKSTGKIPFMYAADTRTLLDNALGGYEVTVKITTKNKITITNSGTNNSLTPIPVKVIFY